MRSGLLPETLSVVADLLTLGKADVVTGFHCDVSIDPFRLHDAASMIA